MKQSERRIYLINELLAEYTEYRDVVIPDDEQQQRKLLRSLFNIRMPGDVGDDFLNVQNEYLRNEIEGKGITDIADLTPVRDGMYLWQGDITTLKCDAIVNAANSRLLGCFCPCHGCIDNAIHTFSGIQLRNACAGIMAEQGEPEPTGRAKITPAFNLPSGYVIHTVGPIVGRRLTENDCRLLASCYRSCLELAEENGLKSIAFCCISTGEFHFPNERAAEIAVKTTESFKRETNSDIEVIFNVFKEYDYRLYKELLTSD